MKKKTTTSEQNITSTLHEERIFIPRKEFSSRAHIKSMAQYKKMYSTSIKNPKKFWSNIAEELFWFKKWNKVLQWKLPHAKWFLGGKTNVAYNCLDRHLTTARKNKAAIIWEGENGDERTLTYQQLHREVCTFANVLKQLGIRKGDVVAIYMPLIPELAIAMLACARIGATHSIIFGGFSSHALIDRINDAQAKLVVTADGGFRRGQIIPLKKNVDEALLQTPSVKNVVVVQRTKNEIKMEIGRDHWWSEVMENANDNCEAEKLDSEHPLYILYTSGSTGKPKGVLHTTGGYLTQVFLTTKYVLIYRKKIHTGVLLILAGLRDTHTSFMDRFAMAQQQ